MQIDSGVHIRTLTYTHSYHMYTDTLTNGVVQYLNKSCFVNNNNNKKQIIR